METIFGLSLYGGDDFLKLLVRLALNTFFLILIVRYLYYSITRRKDYLFTYLLIGTTVFILSFLLESVKIQLGFALGLFAVFGILRYRTQQIPIKEMTYLFIVIGISIINALANKKISYAELLLANGVIYLIAYLLEKQTILKHESTKNIRYERIELIKPENRAAMIKDLEERTGLVINRIEIGNIDFSRDIAKIRIYYYEPENKVNQADNSSMVLRDE
jgi:hypothetical protein